MTKKCIIFDLDGTLRDLTHRLHYIQGGNKNYEAFHAEVSKDAPKEPIITLFKQLEYSRWDAFNEENQYDLFILSGCSESAMDDSVAWLEKYGCLFDRIYMRPEGDHQSDVDLKRSWLHKIQEEGYEVIFTVDDRQCVVDMWREEGITCLQVDQWDEEDPVSIDISNARLHVLVGPSGAGKSRFYSRIVFPKLEEERIVYIGTDNIRHELCGDFKDQSRNAEVFKIYHKDIQHHLECGRIVYADATHIRAQDRKKLLKLLPKGVKATYHIIDRPLEEKLETGGWRLDVQMGKVGNLIEYHHHKFQSAVKYALEGDGDDRVTVLDHRKKSE